MSWPYEPYTLRREPRHVVMIGPIPLLSDRIYTLIFEDTPIRQYHSYERAEDICAMLNAAWNLGYANGKMHTELELESKTEHEK